MGSFLFLGPTGVGKTELAKALAASLFDDEGASGSTGTTTGACTARSGTFRPSNTNSYTPVNRQRNYRKSPTKNPPPNPGLNRVPDPRDRRGVRYPLAGVLAVAVCAVLAWCRTCHIGNQRVISINGKTVRGARTRTATAPYLIAALDHTNGVVLGQNAVEAKSNEIPAVRDLLAGFDPADLHGCVITTDAMHTQDDTAKAIVEAIVEAGADYVFTVKANRPALLKALKALPWNRVRVESSSTDRGHGQRATRTIKVIEVPDLPGWPEFINVAQVGQLRRTVTRNGKKTVEVIYLVTSAAHHTAPPAVLAAWVQSHWRIENALHWVRDVTYDKDRSQVHTGHASHVMASLRNTAIGLLRLAGWNNIAAALRHHARDPEWAITCILTC